MKISVIILAAGKGTRMKSAIPKVLHKIAGRSMLGHVLDTASALDPEEMICVTGPGMDDVAAAAAPHKVAVQQDQNGTGDAVRAAVPEMRQNPGTALILYGDVPLVRKETLAAMLHAHEQGGHGATLLAMTPPDPTGYGRIICHADGTLARIVEEADASEDEKKNRLCNAGIMAVDRPRLGDWLAELDNNNAKGEYYLVDLPGIMAAENITCGVYEAGFAELQGANDRAQLARLEELFQRRARDRAMAGGVTLQAPETVWFSHDTRLGRDVVIEPHVVFGPGVDVGDNVHIRGFSHIEGATIGAGAQIGPYARLRPGTELGENVRIGNFVEVKNASLGAGAKANHLAYIGDASLGAGVNFAAGAITANYDGRNKHRTTIGAHAMIGCNVNLIAPVTVADHAYVAAGSTITSDVPAGALSVARAKAIIREGWVSAKTDNAKKDGS